MHLYEVGPAYLGEYLITFTHVAVVFAYYESLTLCRSPGFRHFTEEKPVEFHVGSLYLCSHVTAVLLIYWRPSLSVLIHNDFSVQS